MITLTIDLNGGNISGSEADVEIEDVAVNDNLYDLLSTAVSSETGELYGVVQTGYTLAGYAYDAAGTEPVGESDYVPEDDETVYLIWELDE